MSKSREKWEDSEVVKYNSTVPRHKDLEELEDHVSEVERYTADRFDSLEDGLDFLRQELHQMDERWLSKVSGFEKECRKLQKEYLKQLTVVQNDWNQQLSGVRMQLERYLVEYQKMQEEISSLDQHLRSYMEQAPQVVDQKLRDLRGEFSEQANQYKQEMGEIIEMKLEVQEARIKEIFREEHMKSRRWLLGTLISILAILLPVIMKFLLK